MGGGVIVGNGVIVGLCCIVVDLYGGQLCKVWWQISIVGIKNVLVSGVFLKLLSVIQVQCDIVSGIVVFIGKLVV